MDGGDEPRLRAEHRADTRMYSSSESHESFSAWTKGCDVGFTLTEGHFLRSGRKQLCNAQKWQIVEK